MDFWILVYSPITNEKLIKLAYFRHSYDLEEFVLNYKASIVVHHFEQMHFEFEIQVNHYGKAFQFVDK